VTWIKTISYQQAEGRLQKLYQRIRGPDDHVDNIMRAHSLRPHSMEGHMALYKAVLHHPRNSVAPWFLEAIGVYASLLNGCAYCVEHHFAGLKRLLEDPGRARDIRQALESDSIACAFNPAEQAALRYVSALTRTPASLSESDIHALREVGWKDEEVLEINQVTAYFNYANRTVLGLGVTTDGDRLGLSPAASEDADHWHHG